MIGTFLRGLSRLAPQSELKRSAAVVAGGTLFAQAIQALAMPILCRLYTPSVFGDWALLYSVSLMASALGGLRYELAVVMAEEELEARRLVALQTICNVLTSLLTLFTVLLFRDEIARLIGLDGLESWLLTVPAITFLFCLQLVVTSWLLRRKCFVALANFRVGQSLVTALVQMGAARLFEGGVGGLIVGAVAGLLVPIAVVTALMRLGTADGMRSVLASGPLWQAARKFQNFPIYKVPYGIVGMVRERGLYVILGIWSTTHVIGLFALAQRLVNIPIGLVSSSLTSVLFQRAATESDIANLAPLISRLFTKVAAVATPAFVVCAWYAPDIFRIVMGPEWTEAGVYAAILAVPAYGGIFSNAVDRLLDVVNQQRVTLVIELSYSAAAVVLFTASLAILPGEAWAVAVFAGLTFLYQLAWVIAVYRFCRFPFGALVRLGARMVLLSSATALILWLTIAILPGNIALVVIGVAAVGYYGFILLPGRKPGEQQAERACRDDISPAKTAGHY